MSYGTCRAILVAAMVVLPAFGAAGEVRIGKGVRIGGHDVAPQVFTRERNGVFYIYEDNPKNPGCRWRDNGDGTKSRICHLKRKK